MQKRTSQDGAKSGVEPTFAPLVLACAAHGIGRTSAFKLAKEGWVETFKIGASTFVDLDSLRTLPKRLKAAA
jgi:hypothetical protein